MNTISTVSTTIYAHSFPFYGTCKRSQLLWKTSQKVKIRICARLLLIIFLTNKQTNIATNKRNLSNCKMYLRYYENCKFKQNWIITTTQMHNNIMDENGLKAFQKCILKTETINFVFSLILINQNEVPIDFFNWKCPTRIWENSILLDKIRIIRAKHKQIYYLFRRVIRYWTKMYVIVYAFLHSAKINWLLIPTSDFQIPTEAEKNRRQKYEFIKMSSRNYLPILLKYNNNMVKATHE